MGAGGVLSLFLVVWVWVWAMASAAGRSPSHWGPRLAVMSAMALTLPLVSSSALFLQRGRLVSLAAPDERSELSLAIDASGGDTALLLSLLSLLLLAAAWYLGGRSSDVAVDVPPRLAVPALVIAVACLTLAAWTLAQLAGPLGLVPLTTTFWLVALAGGWAAGLLGTLYGAGVLLTARRA